MKVAYGDMVLEVDAKTGRARRVTGSVAAGMPRVRAEGYDSKLEQTRARELGFALLAGEIRAWRYHPFTVPIGVQRTYTPDFLVVALDGAITLEEIKGSLKAKNGRDSVTRLHAAAALLPMFRWELWIQKGRARGGWDVTRIG